MKIKINKDFNLKTLLEIIKHFRKVTQVIVNFHKLLIRNIFGVEA